MLIAVISDSHNNIRAIEAVKKCIEKSDVLIFLGDGEEDISKITENYKGEIYSVKGNCDLSNKNPEERIIEICNNRIFICHGHKYGVKHNYNNIYYRGRELEADIVLFGHTHIAMIEEFDKITLMNPGSISHSYSEFRNSLGFIEIFENNEKMAWIKELKV